MIRLLAIALSLLLLLGGAMLWSGGSARRPADFVFINRGDIRTLDPNRMSWMEDIRLGYALYEGLCTLHPETLEAIPGSAGRIDLSADKTVYTFHIRPEARWSNGDALEATDFIFAWRRMLEQPGDYTYLLDYIKGAAEYRDAFAKNRPAEFKAVGIEAVDARTLRVTLKHPVTFFLDLCAFPPYFPLNERTMRPFAETDAQAGRVSYRKEFMRPPNLVTNGPYRLAEWEFKKRVRLIASEHYWGREQVKSRVIDQLIVDDNKLGEFLRYETGTVQWLADASSEIAAELLEAGRRDPAKRRTDLHIFPGFGTYFYSVNCNPLLPDGRPNPFQDVRVRRAFAMALRKEPIVQTITRLGESVARHYVPPGIFAKYESPRGIDFDVEAARKLLAEAGYPGGRGFPRVRLLFNTGSLHGDVAQVASRQWLQNLGVNIELEPVEPAIFSERLHNKEYAIARASWFGDYNDVSTFSDKYRSTSDNNDSAWINSEYDRLCDAAAREADPDKRLAMLSRAEGILLDEVPIIPVYYYVNKYMFRANVKGLPLNPRNMLMFQNVQVVK